MRFCLGVFFLISLAAASPLKAGPLKLQDPTLPENRKFSYLQMSGRLQTSCADSVKKAVGMDLSAKLGCFVGFNAVQFSKFMRGFHSPDTTSAIAPKYYPIITFAMKF